MYKRYRLLTRGLPATKPRKKLTDLRIQHFRILSTEIAFEHQVTDLLFNSTAEKITCIILQRTSTNNTKPKVAESENIGANHLGFVKSLFQQYTESAFNFYVNNKITECLGGTVNIEAARENFYTELFQHTNLPKNYSFAPIIKEINQTIERYTQQQFPITYADKGKRRIQTSAATPKGIQLPSWKKHRVELPTALSYHYMSGSAINISSADSSTSNQTMEKRLARTIWRIQSPPPQPDFGTATSWKLSEEEEEKELEDQEFTYQNPITENPEQNLNLENSEIETPNHQRQNNPNPELINQQNLPLIIIINQPLINLVAKPIQQPFQLSPQQPVQQQLLQQPPQQPNLDPMAYAPITKLNNFTGKENNVQDTIDAWYQSLAIKPQTFNDFKMEFVRYFSNNNSINNNLLQRVRPMHLVDLPTAITHARDFEAAELEANHAQAVNLVMNRSFELDSKLKQFTCRGSQKYVSATTVVNKAIFELIAILIAANDREINTETPIASFKC
ncbi:hypothetical protein G9A89_007215 [Geosiphon pyriformis]|nr:hypothetical protein G9A89_007215 [Geosiphon pyriformis]